MKRYFSLIAGLLCLAATISSCSNDEDFEKKQYKGSDIIEMKIKAEKEKPLTQTKGILETNLDFDSNYDPDSIYLHKKGSDDVLAIPVYKYDCDDIECNKGFRYHIDVKEDGSTTIIPFNADGELLDTKLELAYTDSCYFSSLVSRTWKLQDNQVTIEGNDTLYNRIKNVNKEIYRSTSDFSIEDLTKNNYGLTVKRACSAFSVVARFYDGEALDAVAAEMEDDPEASGYVSFTSTTFENIMGSDNKTWYVKIMIGGSEFTNEYDLDTQSPTGDMPGGFYTAGDSTQFISGSPDEAKFLPFNRRDYGYGDFTLSSFGYSTLRGNQLFTPVITGKNIDVYILIKHWTGGEEGPDEEWLRSNNGALRTKVRITDDFSLNNNRFYTLGLLMEINQFKNAWDAAGGDAASEEAAGTASIASKGLSTAGVRDFTLPDAKVVFEAY